MTDRRNERFNEEIMQEKGEIVIYQTQDGITQLDVRLDGDTVWLSQDQMAQLFERDKSVITRHISNIYAEGELPRESTSAKIAFVLSHCYLLLLILPLANHIKIVKGGFGDLIIRGNYSEIPNSCYLF